MKQVTFGRIRLGLSLVMSVALAAPGSAQDLGTAMLRGLGKSALTGGEELLKEGPDRLNEFLKSAEQGQTFPSQKECLGALQLAVNAGAIVANLLPFSSVETFEDKRGPVARFRVMLNGEKVHLEAFCSDVILSAVPLPWGEANPAPERVTQSSLDAIAGLLLLAHAQGAFDKEAVQTSKTGQPLTSQSWSNAVPVIGFPSFQESNILSDGYKIVNFTASRCATCSSDRALLTEVDDDIPVYGVFFRETAPSIDTLLSDYVQPYDAMISDVTGEIASDYGVFGVPETLLVGPQGVVLARHKGPLTRDVFSEQFLSVVDTQLAPLDADKSPLDPDTSESIKRAIAGCWNSGTLSTDALRSTIRLSIKMNPDRTVQSIEVVESTAPSKAAESVLMRSARSAIYRCIARADLDPDRYEMWSTVELSFDPSSMRLR